MIVALINAVGQKVENEGAVVQHTCSSFFISSQDELIGRESVRASVNTFKHEYLRSRRAEINQILFYLQVIMTFITSRTSSEFGQIGLKTMR